MADRPQTQGNVKCSRCGETSHIAIPSGVALSSDAAFVCRKCAGSPQTQSRKRKRIAPYTREGREVPWDDYKFRNRNGQVLSGEEGASAAAEYFDQAHVTSPWLRAHSVAERDEGLWRQEIIGFMSKEDLPKIDSALEGILDEDERWVIKVRARGESRESFLAQLSDSERRKFQAAWRRLTRKMPVVRKALRERVAEQNRMEEFEDFEEFDDT